MAGIKHPTALVESDQIGEGTNVWAYAHVMKGAVVGAHCNIGDHAFVESGAVIGDEVTIKNSVAVWQYVTVKDRVFLGPNCSLTNDNRPRSKRPWTPCATTIDEGATVGANATIVCGCHIGRYAFIGAGAVVTKPVPDYAVVFGNPGRVHGYVCECCQPLAGTGAVLTCKKCGLRYGKTKKGVALLPAGAPLPKAEPAPKKAKAAKAAPKPAPTLTAKAKPPSRKAAAPKGESKKKARASAPPKPKAKAG
jgi:UDP-2-acetamido-3-amino-2,3-dideoxy-glucuronate N-acetyltransferase